MTWYLCGPDVASCDTSGYVVTTKTVANTDNNNCGVDCTYTSGSVNVTSAGAVLATNRGQYCWHAQFVPDAPTAAAGVKTTDDNGVGECFTITPQNPDTHDGGYLWGHAVRSREHAQRHGVADRDRQQP